jgi:hypothetical protein
MSTFALRLVHSDVSTVEAKSDSENSTVGHLLGVFVSLDTDKDSFINKPQLFQALQLVGLRPNETLLNKFLQAQADDNGAASAAAAAVLAFKVSPSVFVQVTMAELREKREEMWEDLDPLLDFAASSDGASTIEDVRSAAKGCAGTITTQQLRHLVLGVDSPTKLSDEEWESFLETIKDIIVDGDQIPTAELKKILYTFNGATD